ncbi:MAG: hypothetical protein WAN36_14100, partial [Calditrichia bacterium]
YLTAYLEVMGDTSIIPQDRNQQEILLQVFLLDKALYELGYELNNRPRWLSIPLKGIELILRENI